MLSSLTQAVLEKDPFLKRTHVAIQWKEIASCVEPFLQSVREKLRQQASVFAPELSECCSYALEGEGKLLRPAVLALSAYSIGNPDTEQAVTLATVLEMLHLASLIHDDVIDGAEIRRNRPSFSKRWGNRTAVLMGDCILSQAVLLASEAGGQKITTKIATGARYICVGETLQSFYSEKRISKNEYFELLALKTGELFALASELGAILADGSPEICSKMRKYGMDLGTAYQIYDDCADMFSNEQNAGKSLGTDLASGKLTLPLFLLLEQTQPEEQARIKSICNKASGKNSVSSEDVAELKRYFKQYSILEKCKSAVEERIEPSLATVQSLPISDTQKGLINLLRFLPQQFDKFKEIDK